ncbi:hypothetical protein ES702_01961 [subsurface metagenome]
MSLEFWKREKNFIAQDKGYVRDPEGFSYKFLRKRLLDEMIELGNAIGSGNISLIIKECSDVSNIVDYISSKAIMNYPDKYEEAEKG